MTACTVNIHNINGRPYTLHYDNVTAIKAGKARDIIGAADARGNGIPLFAPVIQLQFADGETATFDADNVNIEF